MAAASSPSSCAAWADSSKVSGGSASSASARFALAPRLDRVAGGDRDHPLCQGAVAGMPPSFPPAPQKYAGTADDQQDQPQRETRRQRRQNRRRHQHADRGLRLPTAPDDLDLARMVGEKDADADERGDADQSGENAHQGVPVFAGVGAGAAFASGFALCEVPGEPAEPRHQHFLQPRQRLFGFEPAARHPQPGLGRLCLGAFQRTDCRDGALEIAAREHRLGAGDDSFGPDWWRADMADRPSPRSRASASSHQPPSVSGSAAAAIRSPSTASRPSAPRARQFPRAPPPPGVLPPR